MAIEYFTDENGVEKGRFRRPKFQFPPTILAYQVRNTYTSENLGEEFPSDEYDQAKQSLKEWRETWEGEGGSVDEIALFAVIDA